MGFEGSPVQRWYEAAPWDTERMRDLLDPEVRFSVCAGWPDSAVFEGRDQVLEEFFAHAAKSFASVKPEIDEVIEAGDAFVVHGHYDGVAAGTEIPFSLEYVHIWRVRDGRLVSLSQIADTAILADALAGRTGAGGRS